MKSKHKIGFWCWLSLLFLLGNSLQAQSLERFVIGNAGDYFESEDAGNLHWTVGEISVEHLVNGEVISQGFHQTYEDLISTAVWEAPDLDFSIETFPNPTIDWVNVQTNLPQSYTITVVNIIGQVVQQQSFDVPNARIDLSDYPSGTYLLSVQMDTQHLTTFKIQKTNY